MIAAATLLLAAASQPANKCGFPDGVPINELNAALARSAADAIEHAGQPLWQSDALLAVLVSPNAQIGFGSGDVGFPMPEGWRGLHLLSETLNATGYRFRQSSGMPVRSDACGEHVIDVEFVDAKNNSSVIRFTYRDGHIVAAAGWAGWVVTAALKPPVPDPAPG